MTIVILSGPTCSGKTTVEAELHNFGFGKLVSHTTRKPRAGELHGVHYYFVDEAEFFLMREEGMFIETIKFGQTYYGKALGALLGAKSAGHIATVLEPQGARVLRQFCDKSGIPATNVWIDCEPQVQAGRFIERLRSNGIGSESVVRLGEMLSIEQDWRENAQSSDFYSLMLSSTHKTPLDMALQIGRFVTMGIRS